jgi:hypothetical protein
MIPAEIIAFLESLPHGGGFTASCSGGRTFVTFTAFTGVGLQNIREQSNIADVETALSTVAENIQRRLAD